MKPGFVKTANYKALQQRFKQVEGRGAREAGLLVVYGPYGIGKSELTNRWTVDIGGVFLRAKSTWRTKSMLAELASALGLDPRGSVAQIQNACIAHLGVHMTPIVIDEADHLFKGVGSKLTIDLMEALRDITDLTGIVCVLVGMKQLGLKVDAHGWIGSRVGGDVELKPLDIADVRATVQAKCEVAVDEGVIEEIHRQSKGMIRGVLNAIPLIEAWAQANSLKRVEASHIVGKRLVSEFKPAPAVGRVGA